MHGHSLERGRWEAEFNLGDIPVSLERWEAELEVLGLFFFPVVTPGIFRPGCARRKWLLLVGCCNGGYGKVPGIVFVPLESLGQL